MKIISKLGISPVSLNVIDSVIQYSNEHQVQLMLVASRNQIDTTGGYVGLTSRELVKYARGQSNVIICRDHSGANLPAMIEDIYAGFDLIHIDCSGYKGDITQATKHLLEEARQYNVLLEVGTEENTGKSTKPTKFKSDMEFITRIVQPEFVVGGTGSLVRKIYQVGSFDYKTVKELVSIAHSFGVKFKEHNADYSDLADLRQRKDTGVDAINIGPELGVKQTRIVIELAQRYKASSELDAFLNCSIRSGKWEKWVYGKTSDFFKAIIAGHYVYNSPEYKRLIDKLNRETDVDIAINEGIAALLSYYLGGLN